MNTSIYSVEELKIMINDVLKNYSIKKAILFGSYAKNMQNEKSDIDLIIDSDGQLLNINFYSVLEDLVQRLNKKVDLFEISEIKKDSPIYNKVLKEGIIIYER